jgi:hypothetical protein
VHHQSRAAEDDSEALGSSGDETLLFDVRGEAVCPTCGARYRRTLNVVATVD